MKWTKEPPSVPGWYWIRRPIYSRAAEGGDPPSFHREPHYWHPIHAAALAPPTAWLWWPEPIEPPEEPCDE